MNERPIDFKSIAVELPKVDEEIIATICLTMDAYNKETGERIDSDTRFFIADGGMNSLNHEEFVFSFMEEGNFLSEEVVPLCGYKEFGGEDDTAILGEYEDVCKKVIINYGTYILDYAVPKLSKVSKVSFYKNGRNIRSDE